MQWLLRSCRLVQDWPSDISGLVEDVIVATVDKVSEGGGFAECQ